MYFGMFMQFEKRDGLSHEEAFHEGFQLVDAAEEWGLDGAWLAELHFTCLLYTSPSPRDRTRSRMPSSA